MVEKRFFHTCTLWVWKTMPCGGSSASRSAHAWGLRLAFLVASSCKAMASHQLSASEILRGYVKAAPGVSEEI
jgi:hypothetical protein